MIDKALIKDMRKQKRAEADAKKVQTRDNSPIKYILEQQKIRVRQDLLRLRTATDACESIYNYDRSLLHDVFREVEKDAYLHSQWTSRKMKTKEKPFKFCSDSGEENEDITKMFETQWFYDFIDAALDSKYWGFTLIEFGPLVNGEFQDYKVKTQAGTKYYNAITVLDRDFVKPELGIITQNTGAATGISIDDPKYADYLMMVCSDFRDHGILGKASKHVLFKDNALGNWSEWAEVFGMDKRIGFTNASGNDRTNFIKAIRDMGSNAYGVFSETDKVEYIGTQRVDAYKVYENLINYTDGQSAKLVWGQDVVSNNTGKVVGTVGENIANMYGENDAKLIANLVNKSLLPMMANLGFDSQGTYFKWDSTEKLTLSDRAVVDKAISDMGFQHDPNYINNTYGTNVEVKQEPTPEQKIKNMYE